jgi:small subunit ribosomal protein S17
MLERKKQVEGVVVSDKMDKSIVVKVERSWRHPLYGKVVKTAKKFHAHDENNEAREGDRVRLLESRPISKLKKWVLLEIVERPERV